MDLGIEEEPQLSEMSSPEHHQFSGTDTETDMSEEEPLYPDDEKPQKWSSKFLYRARKCSIDCVGSNQLSLQ